jgi:hypothetical protein
MEKKTVPVTQPDGRILPTEVEEEAEKEPPAEKSDASSDSKPRGRSRKGK